MSRVEGGKRSGEEEKNLLLKGVESVDKALCIEKSSSTNSKSSKSLLLDPKSKAKDSKEDNLRKDKKFLYLTGEKFNQPIFHCNNLSGHVEPVVTNDQHRALYSTHSFKIIFKEGGCGTFIPLFFNLIASVRQYQHYNMQAQSYVDPLQAVQNHVDEICIKLKDPLEQLYASQLSQLQEMGFFDRQENIRALVATSTNDDVKISFKLQCSQSTKWKKLSLSKKPSFIVSCNYSKIVVVRLLLEMKTLV
ncbi:hypothetical protein VNO80_09925 [Phaseolus coccineus]|uniref:UBA domain-containing protein n=1 Tax=Phaseolus coccineus TaxID=3886 RepID=A0AAN9N758_PHACN